VCVTMFVPLTQCECLSVCFLVYIYFFGAWIKDSSYVLYLHHVVIGMRGVMLLTSSH